MSVFIDNVPKACGSCSNFNDFSKYQNGKERNPYIVIACVVNSFRKNENPPSEGFGWMHYIILKS